MQITPENYDEIKADLKAFLVREIHRYTQIAGSQNKLALALGFADNRTNIVLKRGSFSALERFYKKCREAFPE